MNIEIKKNNKIVPKQYSEIMFYEHRKSQYIFISEIENVDLDSITELIVVYYLKWKKTFKFTLYYKLSNYIQCIDIITVASQYIATKCATALAIFLTGKPIVRISARTRAILLVKSRTTFYEEANTQVKLNSLLFWNIILQIILNVIKSAINTRMI